MINFWPFIVLIFHTNILFLVLFHFLYTLFLYEFTTLLLNKVIPQITAYSFHYSINIPSHYLQIIFQNLAKGIINY